MTATAETAVVLCSGINGLGVVRALARCGVRVIAVYFDDTSPVRSSRMPDRKHRFTSEPDDVALLAALAQYSSDQPVVIACSDYHADFLSRCRSQLVALGLQPAGPSAQLTELLNDKARELERMMTLPVTLPRSLVHFPDDADVLLSRLTLPIIVKPRSYRQAHLLPAKNVILQNRGDAERFIQECRDVLDGFVAQEIIAGPDEALWVCNCCFDANAELVTAFTFQRIRTSPSHFGVTSFAVGRNNEAIKQQCAAIGKALAYSGPAMFEFKHDDRHDVYCYLETNPRLGMCNVLDRLSGVDNVYAAYQVAKGEQPERRAGQQVDGVVFLNVYADLYSRFKDGESFRRVLRSYWETRHARHAWAFFDARDPLPFVVATWHALHNTARSLVSKTVAVLRRR